MWMWREAEEEIKCRLVLEVLTFPHQGTLTQKRMGKKHKFPRARKFIRAPVLAFEMSTTCVLKFMCVE